MEAFARRQKIAFLSVHCGPSTEKATDGPVTILQLKRSQLRISLDSNLDYDLLLMRYAHRVMREVKEFGAEVIHITGPGDLGSVGAYVSWRLKLPLVISWHTSLHEYAGVRLERLAGRLAGRWAEALSLQTLRWFYRRAVLCMAPNDELVELTRSLTDRPVYLMRRGVDTNLFRPDRRARSGGKFRIGYVGRLSPEKNVRFLAQLARPDLEFVICGEGSQEAWLRQNLPNATFTGVLRGEALAEAYANMDVFAFPSHTDTFGNVVLEALASGVPAVVTNGGGPKSIVQHDVTGFVATSDSDFIQRVHELAENADLRSVMRAAALDYAARESWDSVFESVFRAYAEASQLLSSRVHGGNHTRWQEDQPGHSGRAETARRSAR